MVLKGGQSQKMQQNGKSAQEDVAIKRTALVGMVSLLVLLFFFLMVTISSTEGLTSQVRLLSEHPFTVNGDVSDAKTNLALMRLRTERLQTYHRAADVEQVRAALEELHMDTEELLTEIRDFYLGPAEDVQELWKVFLEIQGVQESLLEFAALSGTESGAIAAYEEEHLTPLYNQFEEIAERILIFVRNTQQRIFVSANRMGKSTLMWSLVIITAMTLGLFFFQFAIRKISRRLYEKNRQFELLSDTVDETFLIFGSDPRRCEFVSGSAERVLGLPVEDIRENRLLVYQYVDREEAQQIHQQLYSEEAELLDRVVAYHHPLHPEPRWMQMQSYRIGERGNQRYIITLTDRTEERRAARALEDALVSAQNANLAKRDFLSRMSHEIRTPMNAIIGMTTIAAASIDDRSRVENCLEKIGYSSRHLLMLINDVLDMSRIESNRIRLNKEPFELYQFLNRFISVAYPQACEKGLAFTEKISGFSGHTTYFGDSLRLNQILLNLTSNAIKFTPRGGAVSLEVTHMQSRDHNSWIRFVVSDTGIGMDEEALGRLYVPFEQANASIAQKYGGTGLGMSITQNLVALMGGCIDVRSKPDEGTTFTVELPFEQSGTDLQPLQAGALESLLVLIADDDQDICEHTSLLLEKMKICAEWVLSGMEAVDKVVAAQAEGRGFDVCLIDWKMPDIDGLETTRRIREKVGRDTPIIIISAYDWSDIEDEARKAGADAFIAKPLFQSSLYNVLVSVTNGAFGRTGATEGIADGSLRGKHVLLAEDNELNMEIAVTLLELNGVTVECAENGKIAVEMFLQNEPGHYDAILMDMQMPVMDGCEAARQIRSCGREDAGRIPIIATTANAFAEDVSAVLAAGMDAHVSKPLDIRQLCSMLTGLCACEPCENETGNAP